MAGLQFHLEHVRAQLMREIGYTITNTVRDSRVPACVTVIDINLAPDTRNAIVFVSIFGNDKTKKGALIALNRAAPFIQKHVAQRVKLKNLPKLVFKNDDSIDHSLRIDELLKEIKNDLE